MAEVLRLKEIEFPYSQPKQTLEQIETVIQTRQASLHKLTPSNTASVVSAACAESIAQLFRYLPILGFVLRSTNVRNSFEVYAPLLRLCRKLIGDDAKLVLSSEWEFSPLIYRPIPELPKVVLIGLPATEAGNPLLISLAGHELGHTLWKHRSLSTAFESKAQSEIFSEFKKRWTEFVGLFGAVDQTTYTSNLFVLRLASQSQVWALQRAEETYCDFLGIRIFAESYLYAFAYLLSPGIAGGRAMSYPSLKKRIEYLLRAATTFGVPIPTGYDTWFTDDSLSTTLPPQSVFLSNIADSVAESLVADLLAEVQREATASSLSSRDQTKIDTIFNAIKLVVPASSSGTLANILNAGWKAHHDAGLWQASDLARSKGSILKDIILKNIEVLEIEELLAVGP